MEDLFKIGIITSTHGVRGEVKVYPTTDDVKRFKKLKECIMRTKTTDMILHLEGCKFFKNMVILKFKEFNNINDIEIYKKCELYVTRDNAVKLDKDEYYISDIIDSKVINDKDECIGTLYDVLSTGANDVYVIKDSKGEELLIPAIRECILYIDPVEKIVKVHIMEGLVD